MMFVYVLKKTILTVWIKPRLKIEGKCILTEFEKKVNFFFFLVKMFFLGVK